MYRKTSARAAAEKLSAFTLDDETRVQLSVDIGDAIANHTALA
jgi:hypothetical protein